jgi:hypothetical protein
MKSSRQIHKSRRQVTQIRDSTADLAQGQMLKHFSTYDKFGPSPQRRDRIARDVELKVYRGVPLAIRAMRLYP